MDIFKQPQMFEVLHIQIIESMWKEAESEEDCWVHPEGSVVWRCTRAEHQMKIRDDTTALKVNRGTLTDRSDPGEVSCQAHVSIWYVFMSKRNMCDHPEVYDFINYKDGSRTERVRVKVRKYVQ